MPLARSLRIGMPCVVAFGLCLATLVTWAPMLRNGFLNYDDAVYVTQNLVVQQGLNWASVPWALRSTAADYWHPVTWFSHALDCTLFGLNPAGHHLTSLLLHVLNTLLLFLLLHRVTGALWPSAFVAALFALHPLRVESVAWVAMRKDLLSTSFFLLTLWAYAGYVSRIEGRGPAEEPEIWNPKSEGDPKGETQSAVPGTGNQQPGMKIQDPESDITLHTSPFTFHVWQHYLLALVFFALGLMSKPMLVTLPFVLLLLDYWPLGRIEIRNQKSKIKVLLLEKLPFFALSLATCVATLAIEEARHNVPSVPLSLRLANTPVAYASYLVSFVWPQHLAVCYPRPASWPAALVAAASLLLAAITAWVCWHGKTRKYCVTGWFWFLGTLLPVIGLVAIGEHWCADRYTYLPGIGLAVALVWGLRDLAAGRAALQAALLAAGVVTLSACALATRDYLPDWKSSLTLFERALKVTRNNYVAYFGSACCFKAQGEHTRAGEYCAKALLLHPGYAPAWNLMASLLADEGKLSEAMLCISNLIHAKPDWNAEAYYTRATISLDLGHRPEAEADLANALRLNPDHVRARVDLATLLMADGQLHRAIEQYQIALRLAPALGVGHYNLANALNKAGRFPEAIQHYQRALQVDPANAAARCNLAQALLHQQRTNDAIAQFKSALGLDRGLPQAHYGLGVLLYQSGQTANALAHLRAALQPNPDFPAALCQLAWILATAPQPELRNGSEALRAAQRACELTGQRDPQLLATFSAALAAVGRFDDAIAAAAKARELALADNQTEVVAHTTRLLEAFRAGRPFHELQPWQR